MGIHRSGPILACLYTCATQYLLTTTILHGIRCAIASTFNVLRGGAQAGDVLFKMMYGASMLRGFCQGSWLQVLYWPFGCIQAVTDHLIVSPCARIFHALSELMFRFLDPIF